MSRFLLSCGGTGGHLDALVARRPNVRRLPGDHCYEFFAGSDAFHALADAELGTFYLTDFLAKHFDALVWQGLGLDRHPELRTSYFGHYTRVLLLSQSDDPTVVDAAQRAAGCAGRSVGIRGWFRFREPEYSHRPMRRECRGRSQAPITRRDFGEGPSLE